MKKGQGSTLKKLEQLLQEFPWLWATAHYWLPQTEIKIKPLTFEALNTVLARGLKVWILTKQHNDQDSRSGDSLCCTELKSDNVADQDRLLAEIILDSISDDGFGSSVEYIAILHHDGSGSPVTVTVYRSPSAKTTLDRVLFDAFSRLRATKS